MKKSMLLTVLCAFVLSLQAQNYYGPRLFVDIPSIYLTSPDVSNIKNRMGAGAEAAFDVGTHWCVGRIGGGATFSLDPKSSDVKSSFLTTPYAILEAGLGKYRSNGNRCAKSHQSAFTAMAKGGLRYNFQASVLDYTLGGEFGYFFIRDMFRNTEIVLSGNYLTKSKVVTVNFGFKFFLNLRAQRD